jgi:hypothetical protein
MRVVVKPSLVSLECRCGRVEYRPALGAAELSVRLPNSALTTLNTTVATVHVDAGDPNRRAMFIEAEHAEIIKRYMRFVRGRDLEPRLFCRRCFEGRFTEGHAAQVAVTRSQVAILCACTIRLWRVGRIEDASANPLTTARH